jgi:hypothetical protein
MHIFCVERLCNTQDRSEEITPLLSCSIYLGVLETGPLFRREEISAFQCTRLTDQSGGPPPPPHPSQTQAMLSVLNIYITHRGDGRENTRKTDATTIARQRLGKHVPAVTNTHITIEELLDASFSMRCLSYQRKVGGLGLPRTYCLIYSVVNVLLECIYSVLNVAYY